MIVDKLMERAHAIGGLRDAEISQIDYEIDGDDTVVYLWLADDFNGGNPIIASVPTAELVDRDMMEAALHLRFSVAKGLRAAS